MELRLEKQPQKYLAKCDAATQKKLYKALDNISRFEGNIRRLEGHKNKYRYKLEHYRITFEWIKGEIVITVIEINTRSNISYK